ncbi:MAG: hydrogenase maturation nickel metallochaperone HypA [Candidatus Eremiobacteraeota bacterium]|nr:hydrogenase maturation nickel metallochaperone HypA [Candidatus Eremiobacteraeota bacterium]MBC5821847.1 hydrogenase maturation nickel metallochaperone HypA [Candidatus Eremiobacteraeota bacterium]
MVHALRRRPRIHELSIALSLLDEIGEAAAREGASRVTSVRLRIGRLSGVTIDALCFAWDLARADTVASEAELLIDDVPVSVACPQCEREGEPREGGGLICPACGAPAPLIVRGRELELVAMEVPA